MTLAPAATQLIEQVNAFGDSGPEPEVVGDADGIGFYRAVKFNAATSKWLVPVLGVIDDERIDHVDYSGKGQATVHFVADVRADFSDRFPLEEVRSILDSKD